MSLSDLMKTPVQTVPPSCTIADAARRMIQHSVGALVVQEAGESAPTGIVTDRDLVRLVSEGLDPSQASIDALTRPPLVTASVDDELGVITEKMHKSGVRRLPVVDARGALVGIVALDDILVLLGRELAEIGEAASHLSGALKTEFLHEDAVKLRHFLVRR